MRLHSKSNPTLFNAVSNDRNSLVVSLLLPDRDNSSANSIKQYQYNTYAGDACFSDAIFVETAVFFFGG